MYVEQLYTNCLSEAAYYIESDGEAAIVDPLRDIDQYLKLAEQRNARIRYIFETHFHADFVSGHLDLAKATGATIVYGPETRTAFDVHVAADGEVFNLGKVSMEVMHTPGHTLESACYVLRDEKAEDYAVFTGDTLFVGDVGRPDLAQGGSLSMNDLASMMYDSLHNKLMKLEDNVIVYPAHGPGSACGKSMGPETHSTIGTQKETNYALKAESREAFIKAVTDGLEAPPSYFPINARINREGYESLEHIIAAGLKPLSPTEFKSLASGGAIILDTRHASVFTDGFVPGSIFIGLEGRFAEWAGGLLPFDKDILLVTETGKEEETLIRLARVGFSRMKGFLDGGFDAWKASGEEIDMIINVEADELAMDLPFDSNLVVLDVRKPVEFAQGHVKDATNIPLEELTDPLNIGSFEDEQNIYIHCAGGYRSLIAASLFKRMDVHNIRNVEGGWKAISQESRIPTEKEKEVLN